MGVLKGWEGLPFETLSLKEFMKRCVKYNWSIAVDWLGSFYAQLMNESNKYWLEVNDIILIVECLDGVELIFTD